jgi:ABC-type multidrug transport system fused ATPase/permease subunit
MTLYEIVLDYIRQRKGLYASYVITCCILYVVKVLVTSFVYSGLFKKDAVIEKVFKQICGVWVLLCVLYVTKSRIETIIIPDFLSFLRLKLFSNYIRNNEINFNDTDVTSDVTKILEVTRNIRDIFVWIVSTFIPTSILMFTINIYFLVKYPKIGAINIIGNIVNLMLILRSAPVLIQSSNERENRFIKMVGKLEENFNNLLNIYLNDKTKDTIKDNEEIETNYIKIYRAQNKELEQFSGRLKVNNYLFSFISMYMLYKQTTDHSELVNGLLIFTFYLGTLENMSEDIPFSLMTLGNIKNIEDALVAKDPNHVRVHPIYADIDRTIVIKDVKGKIDFDNVWFRYYTNEDKYVLKNFSLHIKEGAKIALVSQSGFGKTTSMKLLLGFYKPEKGNILLDGVNIKDIPLNQLRTYINYINQKTFLFHDTIINNMKYGNTKTTEFIIEFLKNNDLITIFCDGKGSVLDCLNKTVEKNGTNISMGMQKVIFLVRGILKDNTSVYVFDEPLTSIDPATRTKVLRMIQKETSTKTVIIITHDKEVSSIVDSTINLSELNSL